MKEKTKNLLILSIIILSIFAYWGFSAYRDYNWQNKYIKTYEKNWILFSVQKNSIDIFHPYSIFKDPVGRLGFREKKSLKEISPNIFYIKELWISKEIGMGGTITEDGLQYLLNCNNYQTGWGKNNGNGSPESFEWSSEEKSHNKKECEEIKKFID